MWSSNYTHPGCTMFTYSKASHFHVAFSWTTFNPLQCVITPRNTAWRDLCYASGMVERFWKWRVFLTSEATTDLRDDITWWPPSALRTIPYAIISNICFSPVTIYRNIIKIVFRSPYKLAVNAAKFELKHKFRKKIWTPHFIRTCLTTSELLGADVLPFSKIETWKYALSNSLFSTTIFYFNGTQKSFTKLVFYCKLSPTQPSPAQPRR
jgi:hypothetical protein